MSGKVGWGMWLQLYHGLPSLDFFFYVLYVESCHLQSWQVLSLLFHAFWHWNGWIIVNFFWTKFLFCWFQSLIDPFFTSFFPCLSVLRWTWPIGEFSGVYLLCSVSFLVSFFLVEVEWRGIHMWYSPAPVQTQLALRTSPTFALLGCLAPVGPWAAGHPCSVLRCLLRFNKLFLCGFLQVCSTVLHWPVTQGLGAQSAFFFCQDGCCAWSRARVGTGLS